MLRAGSGTLLLAAVVGVALARCNCREPQGPCQADSDCLSEELCFEGQCRATCNADPDCLYKGQFCRNGMCIPVGDAGSVDAAIVDSARDAGSTDDPCAHSACPQYTSCLPLVDGGHLCLCGREICAADQVCRTPQGQEPDGGAELRCCAATEQNCGGACVDMTQSTDHCGRCFNACSSGSECFMGRCRCQYSAQCAFGRPPENTVPRCLADGGRELRDANQGDGSVEGRCDFSQCTTGWANCDDAGVAGCETYILGNDSENCGACRRSALQYRAVDGGRIPLTSRCINGAPSCQTAAPCAQSVCWIPPDGGVAQSRCLQCTDTVREYCGGGGCCNGQCVTPTDTAGINTHCGCGPLPGHDAGVNCQTFALGSDAGGRLGRTCVDPAAGTAIAAGQINRGVCGCSSSGTVQCGQSSYNNEGLSQSFNLAGVCDPATHSCRAESRSSCGVANGVRGADGGAVAGATCDPTFGGILCVEGTLAGTAYLGVCGCGGYAGDVDQACQVPVMGTDGRPHLVADKCTRFVGTARICQCYNGLLCDPNSATPDCCAADGCVDLATDPTNCGNCGTSCQLTLCGPSTADGGREPGQCACTGTSTCPTTGGGGGPTCVNNRCVCPETDGGACPLGTWCVSGTPQTGSGDGCCESRSASGLNRCPISAFCPPSEPVLCVDSLSSNKYQCCPAGSRCANSNGLVTCVTE